ncbi:MAG: transporter substrate-binding domain-containing protein [Paucibacter sp.]|nr:transporter substrate-binding domain-containing protein [Roseateles sp.]
MVASAVAMFEFSAVGSCEAMTFYTEISVPQTYYPSGQETLAGFSFELVSEMARRAGISASFTTSVPWARAQAMVADPAQKDACLFSVTQTPERLHRYQWVGPMGKVKWTLFARAEFDARLRTLEDARRYRIGGYNRDARTEYLKSQLGFQVDAAPDDRINARKLATGRIDLWISNFDNGTRTAETVGLPGVKPVLTFHEDYNYLACGPGVPRAEVAALQSALDSICADGTRARLTRRYHLTN